MTELQAYAPLQNKKQAMYLAATLRVRHEITNPTMATNIGMVICQVLSLRLPELMAVQTETTPDTRYGGHVNTSVIVSLNPRAFTTVGKNELKLLEARCNVCMTMRRYRRESRRAMPKPEKIPPETDLSIVSASIRCVANSRSSGVSHRVLLGLSGRIRNPSEAIPNVTTPCAIK
jgi:hypothetical protein